jgi:hypothetical protein
MSIVLGDTLADEGRAPVDANRSKSDWYVVALTCVEVRAEEQGVVRDPLPGEGAHGNVVGEKKKARRRRFAAVARWIVAPPV